MFAMVTLKKCYHGNKNMFVTSRTLQYMTIDIRTHVEPTSMVAMATVINPRYYQLLFIT